MTDTGTDTAPVVDAAESKRLIEQVQVENGVARLNIHGATREFEVQELPEGFRRWQLDYKHSIYDAIERDEYIAFNAGHLPVVGTWESESIVPNLANKGVGFTPKDEYIDHYLKLVEDAVEQISKLPPQTCASTKLANFTSIPNTLIGAGSGCWRFSRVARSGT